MWNTEDIKSKDYVYRTVHNTKLGGDRKKKTRFPTENSFIIRDNESGLSVNWDRYCCEKKSLILIGLRKSNSSPSDYIDPRGYLVFKFPVSFLMQYGKVLHKPEFSGNPSNDGNPNNKSHSELTYELDEIQTRMELSDYCCNNLETSFCDVNKTLLYNEVEDLRSRLNNTPYHRDWFFDE